MPNKRKTRTKKALSLKEKKKRKKAYKIVSALSTVCFVVIVAVFALFDKFTGFVTYYDIPQRGNGELRIHYVDVGQGDCTILELPDGKNMIIDGGNSSAREKVWRYTQSLHITTFDHFVVTHPDSDHCAGFTTLLDNVAVKNAYLPPIDNTTEKAYATVKQKLRTKATAIKEFARLDVISGENYYLSFLYPYGREFIPTGTEDNDYSAVIWLNYFDVNALFCGDISSDVEEMLIENFLTDPSIFNRNDFTVDLGSTEILKVAHHGSNSSSSQLFLDQLNFETAIISCGANNSYGHPNQNTLERLKEASPKGAIYRTDDCGTVMITISADGTYKTSYEKQGKTLYNAAISSYIELSYIQNKNRYKGVTT